MRTRMAQVVCLYHASIFKALRRNMIRICDILIKADLLVVFPVVVLPCILVWFYEYSTCTARAVECGIMLTTGVMA